MRPKRMRLGCAAMDKRSRALRTTFNEAEAHAPRMHATRKSEIAALKSLQ